MFLPLRNGGAAERQWLWPTSWLGLHLAYSLVPLFFRIFRIAPQLYERHLSPQAQHYNKNKKSQSPICTLKRNSSSVTVPLGLLPALPHIPLVLFSPWGLQPSQASLRCFSGHGQPPQRCSAQPRILYWQQHSFTLQKNIHLTGLTISYVSTCTQRQKITLIVLLEGLFCFFFVKASFFCCPTALSQHIAQCFLY